MTNPGSFPQPRWLDYILDRGEEVLTFWKSHLQNQPRNVLFILGKGFDPRMCIGLEAILAIGGSGKRTVMAIELDEGISSPSTKQIGQADINWVRLNELVQSSGATLLPRSVQTRSPDGRRIASRNAAGLFRATRDVSEYTDVVVDISAMPRGVYFPLIAKLLHLRDEHYQNTSKELSEPRSINIHVLVAENPVLDRAIRDEGVDDVAVYVHPFSGGLERSATAILPRIWIPLLGESQGVQLERIHTLVAPDEICPVLPSPSMNPRRGDELVLEYQELLFSTWLIERRDFIYATEDNPFEVYRQIRKAVLQYYYALAPVGGCKTVISALSSKLMSVGALLVAYEFKGTHQEVGIAHVESQGFVMQSGADSEDAKTGGYLVGLWLAGECYEA